MPSSFLVLALACAAVPAFAQTTTVTTQSQQQATPPPPPSSTTTVTTQSQPQPPPPTTQVVVNPNDPGYVPPPAQTTVVDNTGEVTASPTGRSAIAIIATDAVYGGVGGAVIGGGITLIDQGNNWARNLMIGAGVGILVGAAYGVYESATQPPPRRAVADVDHAASNVGGFAFKVMATPF
jgi:hypothetical protein